MAKIWLEIEGDDEDLVRVRRLLLAAGVSARELAGEPPRGSDQDVLEQAAQALGFSRRQLQCAGLALEGLSNDQVAEQLGLQVGTVAHHMTRVYEKAGVRTRAELFCWLRSIRRDSNGRTPGDAPCT